MRSFGVYDECIDTVARSTRSVDKGKTLFRGQYCTIDIIPSLPSAASISPQDQVPDKLKAISNKQRNITHADEYKFKSQFAKLRTGVCVPSGCTLEDVDKFAKIGAGALSLDAYASRCEVKKENEFTPLVIAVLTCYSFAGFMVLAGSLIDLYGRYKKIVFKRTAVQVLVAFSFFSNVKKFADTTTASDTLSCLNGIRFLGMSWLILAHTYYTIDMQLVQRLEKVRELLKAFTFQTISNSSDVVDTFFFIGGLLVCYLTIKNVRIQGRRFKIGLYIFHRLWRIIPVYVFVIMFVFLENLMGSGPIWTDSTMPFILPCNYLWWTNLLFINNFYYAKYMCLPHSWYIAVDVQLYVGALIILLPMLRWPKVGISLSVLTIVASMIYPGVVTYVNDYPPTLMLTYTDSEKVIDYSIDVYYKPFTHAGPYCIGILTGYLLATRPKIKIPPLFQVIGWCFMIITNVSVLFGTYEWNLGREIGMWEAVIYSSLNRVAWTLGIAWMTVCCATGHGGIINTILSWKVFIPLGRLTYLAYLIHPLVQVFYIGNMRTNIHPSHLIPVYLFLGHLCITFGIAFAGSMLIESPFMAMEKIIMGRSKDQRSEIPSVVRNNSVLMDTPKNEKNGHIATIIAKTEETFPGCYNNGISYKL